MHAEANADAVNPEHMIGIASPAGRGREELGSDDSE